jgi:hypothetical protein
VADQYILDVRLQKEFNLGKGVKLAIFGDGLNLLNDDANESIGDRRANSDAFALPTQFILPRRGMLGAKIEF